MRRTAYFVNENTSAHYGRSHLHVCEQMCSKPDPKITPYQSLNCFTHLIPHLTSQLPPPASTSDPTPDHFTDPRVTPIPTNRVGNNQKLPTLNNSSPLVTSLVVLFQLIGHISAAHLNPAVSVAAIILGKINIPMAVVYILAELSGGIAGFGLLQVVTPDSILRSKSNGSCCALCVTLPHPELSAFQAVLAEALATSVLILVVCAVWDKRNERNTDSVPLEVRFYRHGHRIG
ncbi:unnamed protein product [Timema podura]|uniref:Uncharacterized protein n=1 Tax=Timema podura TaxID=61482 RepID=A0ABN7P5G8_TIMPD|nr:unnamed protein product [Timema podura]